MANLSKIRADATAGDATASHRLNPDPNYNHELPTTKATIIHTTPQTTQPTQLPNALNHSTTPPLNHSTT